jgi:hypothetical protein
VWLQSNRMKVKDLYVFTLVDLSCTAIEEMAESKAENGYNLSS